MADKGQLDDFNWVDPDILTYYENDQNPSFDFEREKAFRNFFVTEWPKATYDHLRPVWGDLVESDSAQTRVLAKTAFWSLAQVVDRREKFRGKEGQRLYGEA